MAAGGCYAAAVRLLARREHSRAELERKLGRAHEAEEIAAALDRLAAERLQSDRRFAAEFIVAKMAGWGRRRLLAELRERGVAAEIAAEEIEAGLKEGEQQRAEAALRRKYGGRLGADERATGQALRFLAQRGFDGASAAKALAACRREAAGR
ncbi:MAG: regulatory protein RecX [Betaproteobacteria bacterium AqS2]|uniref:Regulatory protein RecX n=1 Tax=Candidatus Amphirhobacter heronislandensis TaxID=1732024 RepID=A0A930Y0T2_9GAMM|nr:regulatory protein RecX [Betaproteobacteria bacterium AqS2]